MDFIGWFVIEHSHGSFVDVFFYLPDLLLVDLSEVSAFREEPSNGADSVFHRSFFLRTERMRKVRVDAQLMQLVMMCKAGIIIECNRFYIPDAPADLY